MPSHKSYSDKYPAYKDSGVEWLGKVPMDWELTRLGTRFSERRKKVSDKDFPPLSVTKNGIVPQLDNAAKSNDGDNRKLVKEGDFVINSRSDRKGSSGIALEDGSVSLINIVMTPKEIHPVFCNYLLKSTAFVEENYRIGHGIVADLWTTRYDEMKNIMVAIPSPSEQTAIANFLDDKTAKIDRAIAQKEQLIALLKERKQIIIQNAVTGKWSMINGEWSMTPKEKMKDSGVEWIGEIPEHWEVTRLGYHMNVLSGYAFPSSGFTNAGVKLLRGINVGVDKIRWDETVFWPETKIKGLEQYLLKAGDIVVGMDRPLIGKGMRVSNIEENDLPCLLLQRVTRLQAHKKLSQEYLALILQNQDFVNYFLPILSGVSVPHISPTQIQEYPIGLPSKVEQEQIIQFVNQESAKIDQAISLQQTQIEKLKEYKATLIDSAVTGKLKVVE